MRPLELAALHAEIAALIKEFSLEDDETLRADMIEGSTNAFEFLSTLVDGMHECKHLVDGIESREENLKSRKHRINKRHTALRKLAERVMETADLTKVQLPEATLSLRSNGPKVIVTDEGELPSKFLKITTKPMLNEIKAALKSGEFVPGATLGNGGTSLNVAIA